MSKLISVRVHGCVGRMGTVTLDEGATVRDAVEAAGGFGGQGMLPLGQITIRNRKHPGGSVEVRCRLDFKQAPQDLDTVLVDNDFIVVAFDADTWPVS